MSVERQWSRLLFCAALRDRVRRTLPRYRWALRAVPLVVLGSRSLWHRSPNATELTVVEAQRGSLLSAVTATGTLEARRTVDVKYDTESPVTRLYVREEDRVRANEPVATMDTSLLAFALAQARQNLERDEVTLSLAKASFQRAEILVADQAITSADFETARANYEALAHQAEADRGAVAQAAEQMGRATIRSPIDGVVIALYVHQGEMLGSATAVAALAPGATASKPTNTLMTIAEAGALEVDADLNAVDLGGVYVGQPAKFTIDAFQPALFDGSVHRISLQPTVTNGVTTYRVVIALRRQDRRFRIGLPTNVMLLSSRATNAILLPPTTILRQPDGMSVQLIRVTALSRDSQLADVMVEPHPVRLLAETAAAVAVSGDIRPGDKILLLPSPSLVGAHVPAVRLRSAAFRPNPDLSDLEFEAAANVTAPAVPGVPPPQPKGFLQRLFRP